MDVGQAFGAVLWPEPCDNCASASWGSWTSAALSRRQSGSNGEKDRCDNGRQGGVTSTRATVLRQVGKRGIGTIRIGRYRAVGRRQGERWVEAAAVVGG